MSDNADILTNAAALLERFRGDERQLEVEIAILQTRLELCRDVVSSLSGKPRTRRPRVVKEAPETAPQPEMEMSA